MYEMCCRKGQTNPQANKKRPPGPGSARYEYIKYLCRK